MTQLPFLLLAGLALCTFFFVSFGSQKLRLPSVLAYIILGVAAAFIWPEDKTIHRIGEIGIVLMFFILGLEFPLARMFEISKQIWPAGFLDVVLNLAIPFIIGMALGLSAIHALMIGSVAYATSSSITAKMLEEQKRLANPETDFILALLIFEDLVAPVLVSFLAISQSGAEMSAGKVGFIFIKIIGLVSGAVLLGHYGFKRLSDFLSRHLQKDFMPLLAVGIALLYSGFAVQLGLSEILGAFLAGVMLSESGKSNEVENLLLPVRDLALPFFFFWFGTTISLGEGVHLLPLLGILVVWAVAGKMLTGYFGGRLFGLTPKTSFRTAFSMVQRGEFSAIIASLAIPQLRIFSGVYILVTAFIGVVMFQKAPAAANWYEKRKRKK
jgi:CPA2 family monovalent cation:H+ antiporter-2